MKTLMYILSLCILSIPSLEKNVKNSTIVYGKVTDAKGENILFASVHIEGTKIGTNTDFDGNYQIEVPHKYSKLNFSYVGYTSQSKQVTHLQDSFRLDIKLQASQLLDEIVVMDSKVEKRKYQKNNNTAIKEERVVPPSYKTTTKKRHRPPGVIYHEYEHNNTYANEQYGVIEENKFIDPFTEEALSTFSIDVDRASYSNIRRIIDNGDLPPKDAVRIEEMVNYFDYEYDQPSGEDPIRLESKLLDCPWNTEHQIIHIALQAKEIETKDLPASNLVFLIDVSGSMRANNKLPLLKSSFKMLLNNLREKDKVAIVTYAGRAGVALESTPASEKEKILSVIENLHAGGSTAGAQGIKTAYQIAVDNFIKDGNNRVILATDGDFNCGISSNEGLEDLIEKKRKSGVFLSVLGYGMGNYKDEKMQTLADKGNGNHAYIDNIQEARKVFVNEFGGTLFTLAKDVKIQIEFNPSLVQAYRLIGYENRLLAKEDFNNDTKDAGEIGSGHVVTALYEIVPVGSNSSYVGSVDPLKYQSSKKRPDASKGAEIATVKFRYKKPDGKKSKMISNIINSKSSKLKNVSDDIRFSIAVAQFGMILRESNFIGDGSLTKVIELAEKSKGKDKEGYRSEFVRLVKSVQELHGDLAER